MFLKLFPALLFDPTETAPGAATPPAEPAPPVEPPAATPPPAEPGPAPWAADLATYIEDENARAQADRYLREKWQPRTTQLEQELAETKEARELWNDLNEDPLGTYLAVTEEMFGQEAANKVDELIQAGVSPEDATAAVTQDQPPTQVEDPVLAQMKSEYEAKQARELFDTELERIKAKPEAQGLLLDRAAISPFVVQSEGDFDAALVGYKQYVDSLRQHYAPQAQQPAPPAPPAVLGTQQGDAPPATPPVAKQYGSFDEALDDYFAETRSQGPPALGTV